MERKVNDNRDALGFRHCVISYLFHVVLATVGTMIMAAIVIKVMYVLWHFIDASVAKWTVYSLLFRRYFPVQIICGVTAGYLNGRRFQGCGAIWVWVIPAFYLIFAISTWRGDSILENYGSAVIGHFFLKECQPPPFTRSCSDQFLAVAPLYSSVSYAIGVLVARRSADRNPTAGQ